MIIPKKIAFVLPVLLPLAAIMGRPFIVVPLSSPPAWAWDYAQNCSSKTPLAKFERLCSKPLDRFAQQLTRSLANKTALPDIGGFVGLYNGYLDYSSSDGMLSFPVYGHREKELFLLITPHITFHFSQKNMGHHVGIDPSVINKSALYHLKKFKTKEKTRFWRVAKVDLPIKDNTIPLNTVVLLSKAKNVYVEEGDFFSIKSPHIVLPNNIFIVGSQDKTKSILKSLDIARFFEHMKYLYEMPNDKLQQAIPLNN